MFSIANSLGKIHLIYWMILIKKNEANFFPITSMHCYL